MLVCPLCGFEKESERKLEFCPKDGSAMRLKQAILETAPTPEFLVGLKNMRQKLSAGAELPTIGEQEKFRVLRTTSDEVIIAPLSTMKERPISVDQIRSVYRRWLVNGHSYTSSDYTGLSVNSVYILRLIREYWDPDKATHALRVHFANGWTINDPEHRIREYTEVEVYKGYDDAHNINDEITLADIQAADNLYAQIMRFRRQTADQLIKSETIREQLQHVPNTELGAIEARKWPGVKRSMKTVVSAFLETKGVGLAIATKLLHLKRPKLFPILDNYVMSFLLGEKSFNAMSLERSKETILRYGLKAIETSRNELVKNKVGFEQLSEALKGLVIPLEKVRMLGILCWTTEKWNIRKELRAPHGTPGQSLRLAKHFDKPHRLPA